MKNRMLSVKFISILLVISLLPIGFAGCGTSFEDLVIGILVEWADAHDVNPTTPSGAANLAKRAASGSTGDEEADAAMGLFKTVHDVQVGDGLMKEGEKLQAEGKPVEAAKRMDEAIQKRPEDWTYRVSRANLRFEQGKENARDDFWAGQKAAGHREVQVWDEEEQENYTTTEITNPTEEVAFYTQYINEMESGNLKPGEMSGSVREQYYETLRSAYLWRSLIDTDTSTYTKEQADYDRKMAEHYKELAADARYH
ncbi:hypothetical protein ACFLXH_03190 [Chloroflexota bacterium]